MRGQYLVALFAFSLGCKVPTEGTGNTTSESGDSSTESGDSSTESGESTDGDTSETSGTTDETTSPETTDAETTDATSTTDATTDQSTTDTGETDGTGSETEDPVDTFDDAMQWYCGSDCSPTKPPVGTLEGCEPEDAHAFCQILTGNPDSVATYWEQDLAVDGPGFCCLGFGPVYENILDWDEVCYESTSLFPDHEGGSVILREGLQCQ